MTSCAMNGDGCCLAQTGSADMLIGFATGTFPSKWTVPRTLELAVGAAPRAITRCGTEMQMARAIATMENNFFPFIRHHLNGEPVAGGSYIEITLIAVASGFTWAPEYFNSLLL